MKSVLKRIGTVLLFVLGGLLALILAAWGVLNLMKFPLYADYYEAKTDICDNPGLSDGFICQGICAYESAQRIFVSGYMKDGSASRIYVTDTDNNSYYVQIAKDGKPFTGHAGGIASYGDLVYIASDNAIHLMSADELLNAKEGDIVAIRESIAVNNEASFIYADDNYVYVGEFHDGKNYVTNHPYNNEDGIYYAIVSRYTHGNLTAPDRVYSIRNKVQGICFTPDGYVVMSTSYGVADSVYYVYREADAVDSGLTLDGAPVYLLEDCEDEFKGPAMAEGLDYCNGKVITLTESASDKYIFGKFFFANKIVGLTIDPD